jgi:hypothetical protein
MNGFRKICQNVLTEKDDWYERLIVRKVSIYISRVLVMIGVSANMVTALSFVLGVIGIVLIGFRPAWLVLAGCVIMQGWYLFDKCDGEVARYWRYTINNKVADSKLESGLSGVFLDNVLHHIIHSCVFISVSFGLFLQLKQIYILGLGLSAAMSMIFISLIIQCKDSIIFNKLRILKLNMIFDNGDKAEARQMSFVSRVFSFVHYLCTFPFVINVMLVCGVINLFTLESESMYLKPFLWFLIFYGIISPIVWIPKFLFYVLNKKIDSEFSQITYLT